MSAGVMIYIGRLKGTLKVAARRYYEDVWGGTPTDAEVDTLVNVWYKRNEQEMADKRAARQDLERVLGHEPTKDQVQQVVANRASRSEPDAKQLQGAKPRAKKIPRSQHVTPTDDDAAETHLKMLDDCGPQPKEWTQPRLL